MADVVKERRRPKWLPGTRTFLFGALVAAVGIYDWVVQNVDFTNENAEQILTAVGVIVMVLRRCTTQPATMAKPPEEPSPVAQRIVRDIRE
jgi:hypothetical protein